MLTEEVFTAGRLCVVGNVNRDVKTAPLTEGERLLHDGETPVSAISETIGGGGANSACAAAGLGAKVLFLGKIGDDSLGGRLQQTLTSHGVIARLTRDPSTTTGSSLALTYADGQRHFISCQPNNEALAFEDLDLSALREFNHLFRADIWFSKAMLQGGNAQLFHAAREIGMRISIDINWDPKWGIASPGEVRARKQAITEVMGLVDVAHGNVRELNEFTDSSSLMASLERLAEWGTGAVVVHLGADGAGYYHDGRLLVEPAAKVERHVNATGTGDLLSVCMMLMDERADTQAKLRLANQIVAEFIEGKRTLIPQLG
jgi:sugar/nucleoside kinase (ribokinase family)